MIEIVTFTGVDGKTDLAEVASIAKEYPFAEFGVLVGSQTGADNPIFPALSVVMFLKALPFHQTAIHLCGKYARYAAAEPIEAGRAFVRRVELFGICHGFGRIQVNLHPDGDGLGKVQMDPERLTGFVESSLAHRVILQHRSTWELIPLEYPSVEYLFDRSEGAGIEGFEAWPAPPKDGKRVGYAGGLGPHNIGKAIAFAGEHSESPVWFDMERNVRSPDYFMDLQKVRAVCEQVADSGYTL